MKEESMILYTIENSLKMVTFLLSVFLLIFSVNVSASTLFVDANLVGGDNDGSSWANAYHGDTVMGNRVDPLQQALDVADSRDQIWIADGVYIPSTIYSPSGVKGGACGTSPGDACEGEEDHLKTFNLLDGIKLYGGFDGGETALEDRPRLDDKPDGKLTAETILSGDVNGNDIPRPEFDYNPDDGLDLNDVDYLDASDPRWTTYTNSKKDNVWHVIIMGNDVTEEGVSVVLNGLIIEKGFANNLEPPIRDKKTKEVSNVDVGFMHDHGAGFLGRFDSNITLEEVWMRDHDSKRDGGAWAMLDRNDNAVLTIVPSEFAPNTQSVFENNAVLGAPLVRSRDPDKPRGGFTLQEERALQRGNTMSAPGAMFHGTATIVNSVFKNNISIDDAGVRFFNVMLEVRDSLFEGNRSLGMSFIEVQPGRFQRGKQGGGAGLQYEDRIFKHNVTSLKVINTIFKDNVGANSAPLGIRSFEFTGDSKLGRGKKLIENSKFINNTSLSQTAGAVIAVGFFSAGTNPEILIKDSEFIGNFATTAGAVLNTTNDLTFDNCLFQDNQAIGEGGAIVTTGSDGFLPITRINNSRFIGNSSKGIAATGHRFLSDFANRDRNFPGTRLGDNYMGGAISNILNGTTIINNSVFEDNFVENGNGGAIANGGHGQCAADRGSEESLPSEDCTVDGDQATLYDNTSLTVSNSTFKNNKALNGNGGAIASGKFVSPDPSLELDIIDGDVNLTVQGNTFLGNEASHNGGAIANLDGAFVDSLLTNVFMNNMAAMNGGAVYNNLFDNGTVSMDDDVPSIIDNIVNNDFFNNKAGDLCGAVANFGIVNHFPSSNELDGNLMDGNLNGGTPSDFFPCPE